MKIDKPLTLLGGLSPKQFMAKHWQKSPLLIRQAIPGLTPLVSRQELFELTQSDAVQSRLIERTAEGWRLRHGPLGKRALPSIRTPDWTVLLQSMDLHHRGVRQLLDQFRFVSDARLDDLMISYASPGGGVGPHFDSYDVFLLQVHGTRRWRIGKQKSLALQEGLPLKILKRFEPDQTFDLLPGDMLYLPPHYAHDGVALDECMTYSIGFRAPNETEMAGQLLARLADGLSEIAGGGRPFADPKRAATATAAQLPSDLIDFASKALLKQVQSKQNVQQVLGEYLTEPGPSVWFEPGRMPKSVDYIALDQRTKMLYAGRQVFINGESFVGAGMDLKLIKKLADQRWLDGSDWHKMGQEAQQLIGDWFDAGWVVADRPGSLFAVKRR